ncbi:MAG: two-component sensor histidine kinase, partial [Nocardia sp.]|nr:two-component sensor histidine kinase [Nocardia sp.]
MSSNPPPDLPPRRWWNPQGWSLRVRLLAGQVLLLVVVVVGIGTVTELALQHFLVRQLDTQLVDVQNRSLGDAGGGPSLGPAPGGAPTARSGHAHPGPGPEFLDRRGIQAATVGASVADGTITAARIDPDGNRIALSPTAQQQLAAVPANGDPVTVDLDGQGSYRVVADSTWAGGTVVTGMPLTSVNATLMRVFLILIVVTAVVGVIAITVGIWVIRRALA